MADTLSNLSMASFVLAAVFLVLTIYLWFFFKIPQVIGDLSNRTARKSIERMRAANEKSGKKSHRESDTNANRVKLTTAIPKNDRPDTGLLEENKVESLNSEGTALLDDGNETVVSEETSLLTNDDETGTLEKAEPIVVERGEGVKLKMIDEVMVINTNEVIE